MNKLVWIGLLIAAVGEGFFWGAGFMGKNTISLVGLLVMTCGALVLGIGLIKEHLREKHVFC